MAGSGFSDEEAEELANNEAELQAASPEASPIKKKVCGCLVCRGHARTHARTHAHALVYPFELRAPPPPAWHV